ncbi:MAG: hypothetical protein PVJ92_02380 [Candidatus Dependentiae bacterium]|jgi:hypothetical protein
MFKRLLTLLLFASAIPSINADNALPDDYFRTRLATTSQDPTTIMGQVLDTPRNKDRTLQYSVLLAPYPDAQAAEVLNRVYYYTGTPQTAHLQYIPRHELPELYTAVQEKIVSKEVPELFIYITDHQPRYWGTKRNNQLAILVTQHQLATLTAEQLVDAISAAGQVTLLKASMETKNDALLEKRTSNYDPFISIPLATAILFGTIFFMDKKGFDVLSTFGTSVVLSTTALLGIQFLRTRYRRKQSAKELKEFFTSLIRHLSPKKIIVAQHTQKRSNLYYKAVYIDKLLAALAKLVTHYKEKQLAPPMMLAKRKEKLEKERSALTTHEEADADPRAVLRQQLLLPYLNKLAPIAFFEDVPWYKDNTHVF